MKNWFVSTTSLLLGLTLLVGGAAVCQIPPLVALEKGLLALRADLLPVPDASPVVALRLSEQEMSREVLADAVARLQEKNVRAILLHTPLTLPTPRDTLAQLSSSRSEWGRMPGATHNKLWQRIDRELREIERRLDGDARLAEAMRAAGNVILVSPVHTGGEEDGSVERLKKYSLSFDLPDWSWQEHLRRFSLPVQPRREIDIVSAELPWEELLRSAAATGFVDAEGGGAIDAGQLFLKANERYFPSALLATLIVAERSSFRSVRFISRGSSSVLLAAKRSYPVDHQMHLLPLSSGMLAGLPVYGFAELFSEDTASLEGKTVVVGTFAHPQAPEYANALMVGQLLGDYQISRPGWLPLVEILVLVYFAVFLWLVVPRLPRRTTWYLMGGFLVVWMAGATLLLANIGWWFQLTPPVALTLAGLLLLQLRQARRLRREHLATLNCTLGEMFQEKGMLDRALEKFQACPPEHQQAREKLYNLGLDFERKRRFGQALGVYEHLAATGKFKDVAERLKRLRTHNGSVSLGSKQKDATVVLDQGDIYPTLGRYEIVSELGQGAMGTVYLGRDPKINREVAIKTLAYGSVDDTQLPMIKERFFREAEAAGRLNHPGIVTIFDAGEEHDLAYLAMEYLEGTDLVVHCKKGNLLPPAEVMSMVAHVAEALAYAHDNEVVHRDIKPANIMLLTDGSIKVTDFGIARVVSSSQTQTGMVLGTPSYMSPEQVAAKKVDGRSDLFSLGSVLYELLSGEKAFVGESMASLMYNISNVKYTPLRDVRKGLPRCCYELVDALLVKTVSRRPKNADEVALAARECSKKASKG